MRQIPEAIKEIRINGVLGGYENQMPLENLLYLSEFSQFAFEQGELDNNLRFLDEGLIRRVHALYGGHGLTNLNPEPGRTKLICLF